MLPRKGKGLDAVLMQCDIVSIDSNGMEWELCQSALSSLIFFIVGGEQSCKVKIKDAIDRIVQGEIVEAPLLR